VGVPVVYCYLDDRAAWLRRRRPAGGGARVVPASRIDT
jgi:hypothetical protein